MKLCKRCGIEKLPSEFPANKKSKDGLYAYCRTCSVEKSKSNLSKPPRRIPPEGMKWCGKCKQDLPTQAFHKLASTYDGFAVACISCSNERHAAWREKNREHHAAYQRARAAANPGRAMEYERKKRYGMERGKYDRMLARQGGGCDICGTKSPAPRKHFAVDHCHETGKVRGLLCNSCNAILGHAQDNPSVLRAAMAYLQSHGC